MEEKRLAWPLVVGGGVLVGLLLVACMALIFGFVGPGVGSGIGGGFRSNGERIYLTATSQRGTPITADMGMGMMQGGMMSCTSCHGPDGRGGQVRMMMRVIDVPDIRYQTLTSEEHEEHGEEGETEMGHEPYTDETIKQAITQGVEPDGEPLDWPMPRWSMSDEDLDDLVKFLKTLD